MSVILIQSDTTVGLISKNSEELANRKNRISGKKFLKVVSSFHRLKNRVPKKFRKIVRKSEKTTFIYPNNQAVRVVQNGEHHKFLKQFGDFFSSSANLSGKDFDEKIAYELADTICKGENGFHSSKPSKIFKLFKKKRVQIR